MNPGRESMALHGVDEIEESVNEGPVDAGQGAREGSRYIYY